MLQPDQFLLWWLKMCFANRETSAIAAPEDTTLNYLLPEDYSLNFIRLLLPKI